jgi:hypothetical protein
MLELNGKPSSVTTFSTKLSFQNFVLKKSFQFSVTKIAKIPYFPHSKSKSHDINSIEFELSRSFQQHQSHITIPST